MEIKIREIDLPNDAAGIASMFNACDRAWPTPFNEGQPITAEMLLDWHEEDSYLTVYLAEADGKIVGYASFMEGEEGQQGEGYLGLLTVDPAYHGHSIGRRLVQACVNRAAQEGFPRHTLGTWPNNLKAVPAYKKTGHFWRPETAAWMQNYVPTALQMPICKPFLARHDWYDTYVRQVEQHEDDFRWEGLKVYPMRWEADNESLALWIDRETQAPVAVETDELFVAAIPGVIEALHGDAVDIHWRITNKTDTVERFLVDARGADGLEIDHREMFVVQPGATVEHVAPLMVTSSTPYSKDDGIAPSVRSVITFGHRDVELFSGVRGRKPVELSTDVGELSAAPGIGLAINLQVQNRRAAPVTGTMRLTPSAGLAASWTEQAVSVPANGHLSLPVTLTADNERVHQLETRLTIDGLDEPLIETLPVFCVGAGGLVWQSESSGARIETDTVRIAVAAKQAKVTLTDKATREMVVSFAPLMGPPYYTTEMHRRTFALAVEQAGQRAVVSLQVESKAQPGLLLFERVSVAPTGLVETQAWLENRGAKERSAAAKLEFERGESALMRMVVPLAQGIVEADADWWPRLPDDISSGPADLAEPWLAWQGRGISGGVGWRAGVTRLRKQWRVSAYGLRQMLAPGAKSEPMEMAVWGHAGSWSAVRARLCRWAGAAVKPSGVRPMAEARLSPPLTLTTDEHVAAEVQADSVMARAFDGHVSLAAAAPMTASPSQFDAPGLIQGRQVAQPVTFALPAGRPGVYAGEARLSLPMQRSATPFHIVRVGLGGDVIVTSAQDLGQEVWRVDNGLAAFAVAAGYGPSVYSWQLEGQEQLFSNYPDEGGLSWERPFFGGITPHLSPASSQFYHGHLARAACTAAAVEAVDRWGLNWQGVRLSAEPDHEDLRGALLQLDLLTVGHSPLLKIVYRLINARGAALEVSRGLELALSLGTALNKVTLVSEDAWHQDTAIGAAKGGLRWAAVVNPQTGRTAIITSDQPVVGHWSAGFEGRLIECGGKVRLADDATHETTFYVALADNLEEARRYTVLKDG